MALVLALSALVFSAPASAAEKPPVTTYLALGDSLAFGYQQERFEINFPNEAPTYFEEGYVNAFAKKLRASKTENLKGLVIVNDGCPGETTDSMIGVGPLGKAVDPEGEAACPYHYKNGLPLHNELGLTSQLEDAIIVLNPCFTKGKVCPPNHPVKAVTFNIGGNDELKAVAKCEAEVKGEYEAEGKSKYAPTYEGAVKTCLVLSSEKTNEHIVKNVQTVLGLIRSPSYGNYAGSIIFAGLYNPDSFVLVGSDALQKIANEKLEAGVAPYGVKYANPFPKFNPAPEGGVKEEKTIGCSAILVGAGKCKTAQPGKYTEMGNEKVVAANKVKHEESNAQEEKEGKTVILPFNGAGDIHPTNLGYVEMGKLVFAQYP